MTSAELQQQKAAARDKKRYVKITYDGAPCICEPRDVDDMLDGCDGATIEDVWMTVDEYEALPEFQGW